MSQQLFGLHRGVKAQGSGEPRHSHTQAQLTFAASGLIQLHTDAGRWLVPGQLAAWIPAGAAHHVEVLADAELWIVHWEPSALLAWAPPQPLALPFALRVTPLMRALLDTAFTGNPSAQKTELAMRLMLHELRGTTHAPTFLPLPASPLGRRIASVAMDDGRNQLSVAHIASRAATSVRTLSRLFQAETGLTFKAWRQRARIVRAIDRLSRGHAIARVSAELGFSSTAAFSCAFRQVTGATPTAFLADSGVTGTIGSG